MALYETSGSWEASQGAKSSETLFQMVPPTADLVVTQAGGVITNGTLKDLVIDGWTSLGDNSAFGGPVDAIKEHAAGYIEFSALSIGGEVQLQKNTSTGVPWPTNGAPVQDALFLRLASVVRGDFILTASLSNYHPGSLSSANHGLGLVARRLSDPSNYTWDTRVVFDAEYAGTTKFKWAPTLMATQRALGTRTGLLTNTTQTWCRMSRTASIYTFEWKVASADPWIVLDANRAWDVAGDACEVGFGFGGPFDRNIFRLYALKIEGTI